MRVVWSSGASGHDSNFSSPGRARHVVLVLVLVLVSCSSYGACLVLVLVLVSCSSRLVSQDIASGASRHGKRAFQAGVSSKRLFQCSCDQGGGDRVCA